MQPSITAAEFKAKCLSLLDEVESTRIGMVITKRGRPVARLVCLEDTTDEVLFGRMRGTITVRGDLIEPVGDRWDADA